MFIFPPISFCLVSNDNNCELLSRVKTVAFPHFLIQPYLQLPKISSFFDARPSSILNDHTYAGVQNIADPLVDKVFGLCPVLFDVLKQFREAKRQDVEQQIVISILPLTPVVYSLATFHLSGIRLFDITLINYEQGFFGHLWPDQIHEGSIDFSGQTLSTHITV